MNTFNYMKWAVKNLPEFLLRQLVVIKAKRRVLGGAFRGMRWGGNPHDMPKLLGTYEMEIAPYLTRLNSVPMDAVINIGAADGYYCAGLAQLFPQARVIAYEQQVNLHPTIIKSMVLNNMQSRIELSGMADQTNFYQLCAQYPRALYFMDIEGGEVDLLREVNCKNLPLSHFLIELHDCLRPGCREEVVRCFQRSHQIEIISSRPRVRDDFPLFSYIGKLFPSDLCLNLMYEDRQGAQEWAFISPLKAGA
jgi:hypothetical protein